MQQSQGINFWVISFWKYLFHFTPKEFLIAFANAMLKTSNLATYGAYIFTSHHL